MWPIIVTATFHSSLTEVNMRYEGLEVISPTEFEVVLYLNQMGVFNFVDDGSIPGCAVLKLSDGRKRSMSLWVEFITASGYLSARKIRSRFQTLVAQAVDKCTYRYVFSLQYNQYSGLKYKIHFTRISFFIIFQWTFFHDCQEIFINLIQYCVSNNMFISREGIPTVYNRVWCHTWEDREQSDRVYHILSIGEMHLYRKIFSIVLAK